MNTPHASSSFSSFSSLVSIARTLACAVCSLAVVASVACSAGPEGEGTERSNEALASGGGGGGGNGFDKHCAPGGTTCTCTGDDDCNDMFSSGVCGDKAICQINSANVPKCVCTVASALPPPHHGPIGVPIKPVSPPLTTR